MPLYEYTCLTCGGRVQLRHNPDDVIEKLFCLNCQCEQSVQKDFSASILSTNNNSSIGIKPKTGEIVEKSIQEMREELRREREEAAREWDI